MKLTIRSLLTAWLVFALTATVFAIPQEKATPAADAAATDVGAKIAQAHALIEEGKYEEARALFSFVIESDPENLDAHAGMARIEIAYGELNSAIDRLEPRLTDNATHMRGNLYLGVALYYKVLQGIEQNKTSGYVASLLNDAEMRLGHATKADPKNLEAHQFLGLVYYYKQDMSAATKTFEAALAIEPKDAFSHYQLGEILQVQAQYEEAIPHYRRATECVDGYADAFRKIGLCHEFLAQTDQAGEAYRQAILAAPSYVASYTDLWRVYGESDPAAGAALLASISETETDNTTLAWYEAHFQRQSNDLDGAIATFKAILDVDPASTSAYLEIGKIHAQREAFDEARDEYQKGLAKNKEANPEIDLETDPFFTALLALTSEYGQRRQFDKAVDLLLKLSKEAPQYGFVWSNLGLVYRDSQQYDEALAAYAKAAELLPYDAQVLNDYGVVLDYNFGRRDEAYVLYKKAVEISENGDAIENLARYYLLNGQYEEAIRIADHGLRLEPERVRYHDYKNQAIERLAELIDRATGE